MTTETILNENHPDRVEYELAILRLNDAKQEAARALAQLQDRKREAAFAAYQCVIAAQEEGTDDSDAWFTELGKLLTE